MFLGDGAVEGCRGGIVPWHFGFGNTDAMEVISSRVTVSSGANRLRKERWLN